MLLILGLILIGCVLTFSVAWSSKDLSETVICATVCTTIIAFISIVVLSSSYQNYIGLKQYHANFENHAQTINKYVKLASNFDKKTATEITDLKYQSYQNSLNTLIKDFRNYCTEYNKVVVGKKTLDNNIIFSWLIIAPDKDMKVVQVSDFLN